MRNKILSICCFSPFLWGAEAVVESEIIDHMVVTSSYSEKSVSLAPASISVITNKQLQSKQVMDITDAIRGVSGVNLSAVGFGRKGIEIRGMDADQTLVLIDGQRVGGSADIIAHSNYELSSIPVNDIERIEIVKGPISALYGSEALGGVINIITKKLNKQWRSNIGVTGSHVNSEGDYQLQGSTSGQLIDDIMSLRVSASKQYQHEVGGQADPLLSDIEGNKNQHVRTNLQWTPSASQKIDLVLSGSNEERWRNTINRSTYYTFMDSIDHSQISISHKAQWQWANTELRAYRSEVERENLRTADITATPPSRITEDVFDGKIATSLAMQDIQIGMQWHRQNLADNVVNIKGQSQAIQKSIFLQDDIVINSDLSLLLGSRFDNHSSFGWGSSPRAYLVYQAGNWTLKGGYGEGFKAPSLKQLSPEYKASAAGGLFYIVGNPDLQPETNKSYELSARYGQENWNISTTIYETKADDLIETFCVSGCSGRGAIRNYRNINQAKLRGIELSSVWQVTDSVTTHFNFNYLDAKNQETNSRLVNKPKTSGYADINWQPLEKLKTQVRIEHVGVQYTDDARLPSYALVHLNASYRLSERLSTRVGIQNLTDIYLPDESVAFEFVEPGRTLYLGAEVSF